MNKLLTLILVCICCISIFGLKVRLDIYVHDKNEVIKTMANKSNDKEFSFWNDVIRGPISFSDWRHKRPSELIAMKQELEAKQALDPNKFYISKKDALNAINEQIRANKNIRFRNNSHNISLLRLAQIQNDILYGNPRQGIIHDLELAFPQNADLPYTDLLKIYLNSDGINPDKVQDILVNILNYTQPLIQKIKGVSDPKYFSKDITKRLQDFYRKVYQIYDSPNNKDKINQLRELVNTSDFNEFYGDARGLGQEGLFNLTHKNYGAEDDESLDNDYYQQYLKGLQDNDAMPIAPPTENTSNDNQPPRLDDILGNAAKDQENQENQEVQENQEESVEAPEDGETSYVPNDVYEPGNTPIPTTDDVDALLSSSLAGPSYALSTMPGLTEEKYEALAKALRKYALKNGIVTDTPENPENFKPYIPKFYA